MRLSLPWHVARKLLEGYKVNGWTSASVILLCCFSLVSCDERATEPTGSPLYFNSFESVVDTTGWFGVTEAMFVTDPAPAGGNQSLHIGGGCLQPTAYIDLQTPALSGYFKVSCWGKLEHITHGGSIGLVIDAGTEQRREIHLIVSDTVWTFYESEESIRCPPTQNLRLEVFIGGFVPAGMFVDCIKVERAR
jgi:hypothetical protein